MSDCTTTVSNSVRNKAPVGQTSRHAASEQCLQTSDDISQRKPSSSSIRVGCSMNCTWRQLFASRSTVLSSDQPVIPPIVSGTWFHSLHATSQALQPMHSEVSLKKPI